jgi:hypothetical protein
VYIEFENANQYMDAKKDNSGIVSYNPTIEISCDNGTTWADYFFNDYENLNLGNILIFNESNKNYTYANGSLTSTFTIGYEINIIARLKENNIDYASNTTAIYNYKLKSVIPDKHIGSCYVETEGNLTGAIDRSSTAGNVNYDVRFEYLNNNNTICTVDYVLYLNNSVVKLGTVTVSGNSYTITPCTNNDKFEYRFYKNDDETKSLMEITDSYDKFNYSNDGWNSMPSTGITFDSNNTYELYGMTFLNVLFREKETSENCFSTCDSVLIEIKN